MPNGLWFTRLVKAEREPGACTDGHMGAGQQVARDGAVADDGKTPVVERDQFGSISAHRSLPSQAMESTRSPAVTGPADPAAR